MALRGVLQTALDAVEGVPFVKVALNGGIRAIKVFEVRFLHFSDKHGKIGLIWSSSKSSWQNDVAARDLADQLKRAILILLEHRKDYEDRPRTSGEVARRIQDFCR
jgi:hypothetical protein